MKEWLEIVITAITGIISGTFASLFAPWSHWGVEKRKIKLQNRKELISACKKYIDNDNFSTEEFLKTSFYSSIRSELTKELVENMESVGVQGPVVNVHIQVGGRDRGVNVYKTRLLDEISKIERKWKLL